MTDIAMEADIKVDTACDIYHWLQEVFSTQLLQTLGGPGIVVQVDESLFKHKPKVSITYLKLEVLSQLM